MATLTATPLKVEGQDVAVHGNYASYKVNYDGAVLTTDTLEVDLKDRQLLFGDADPALSVEGLSESYTVALTNGVLIITPVVNFVASDFTFEILLRK